MVCRWRVWWCAIVGVMVFVGCTSLTPIPPLPPGTRASGVVRTSTGVLVPLLRSTDDGAWVRTPCHGISFVRGATRVQGADVLIDPGHGGAELGAVGSNGLREKDVNLDVAHLTATKLRGRGYVVALTRETDIQMPIRTRGELASALQPRAFVSVHHNSGGPPRRRGRPGSEVYHQVASRSARALAQVVWDALVRDLARFDIEWAADDGRIGPTSRPGENGDYYGVLRYSAGVPAVISEATFISNPAEAELMTRPEFRETEAGAIADGIETFLRLPAPSSGASAGTVPDVPGTVTLPPATAPPDGEGCVDPPLE